MLQSLMNNSNTKVGKRLKHTTDDEQAFYFESEVVVSLGLYNKTDPVPSLVLAVLARV